MYEGFGRAREGCPTAFTPARLPPGYGPAHVDTLTRKDSIPQRTHTQAYATTIHNVEPQRYQKIESRVSQKSATAYPCPCCPQPRGVLAEPLATATKTRCVLANPEQDEDRFLPRCWREYPHQPGPYRANAGKDASHEHDQDTLSPLSPMGGKHAITHRRPAILGPSRPLLASIYQF